MYQPYLRGKQFELIGLQELINPIFIDNKDSISPIIEPVRDSSTLRNTIKKLAEENINFTLITNPLVGDFAKIDSGARKEPQVLYDMINTIIPDYSNFQFGIIIHDRIQDSLALLKKNSDLVRNLSLIHNLSTDNVSGTITQFNEIAQIKYNILNHIFVTPRYRRSFPENTLVQLNDYFQAQTRNSDYTQCSESNFSEEHLYYKEEGYIAYSDFTTIGEPYTETGFLPYAVVIHLSCFDSKNRIIIKHFVSDSNDDTSDVAGKFREALDKLIGWCDSTNYNSYAVACFRDLHNRKHFPGLGSIKKLSMMNHIELVLKLIRK